MPGREKPGLRWVCRIFDAGSGGVLSRALCRQYRSLGAVEIVDLEPENRSVLPRTTPEEIRSIERLMTAPSEADTVVSVRYAPPSANQPFWHRDTHPNVRRNVTFVGLPYGYLDDHRVRDAESSGAESWVPSDYCRRSLVEAGLAPSSVRTVPLGFDPHIFHPAPQREDAPLRFFHASIHLEYCKGLDTLLSAYTAAFQDSDPVELVLQCRPRAGDAGGLSTLVRSYSRRAGPRVRVVEGPLSQLDMAVLMRQCEVYVQTSRAEAFGLPVLEAMATGQAVIAPAYGGHTEFVARDGGVVVPARLSAGDPSRAAAEGLQSIRRWVDIDVDALVSALRWAVDNRHTVRAMGAVSAAHARSGFTWRHSARRVHQLVTNTGEG